MGKAVPAWCWMVGAILLGAGFLFLPVEVEKRKRVDMGSVPKFYWGRVANEDRVAYDFREVESPLVFALPTREGYSEVLMEMPVEAELSFARSVQRTRFLNQSVHFFNEPVDYTRQSDVSYLLGSLDEPEYKVLWSEKQTERLLLSDDLGLRIDVNKIVWPDVEETEHVELRAELEVSAWGRVQHLFIEKPLQDSALNQQLVRFLYGLRFEPGSVALGHVEYRVWGER